MFRAAVTQLASQSRRMLVNGTGVRMSSVVSGATNQPKHINEESNDAFDKRFIDFFSRKDLDGWLVRKGMTELHHYDCVPEPEIVIEALKACRRVNDFALAVRFLESIKVKCGPKVKEIYPWMIQQIQPTLTELGISTPEELGYDKPELFLPSVDYWDWEKYGDEHTKFYKEAQAYH